MTQGVTGTFAINGLQLLLQPTEHSWASQDVLGNSGEGRPTYPSVRKYNMAWGFMSMEEYNQLESFFLYSQNSGTVVVDLPKFATTPYQFYSYSGCVLQEPTVGKFFETYVSNVELLIIRVRA